MQQSLRSCAFGVPQFLTAPILFSSMAYLKNGLGEACFRCLFFYFFLFQLECGRSPLVLQRDRLVGCEEITLLGVNGLSQFEVSFKIFFHFPTIVCLKLPTFLC